MKLLFILMLGLPLFIGCNPLTITEESAFDTPSNTNSTLDSGSTPIVVTTHVTNTPTVFLSDTLPSTTKTPTSTFEPTTKIAEGFIKGDKIIAVEDYSHDIYVVNTRTGYHRLLQTPDGRPNGLYRWMKNGCELIVLLGDRVLQVDLHGNIKQVLFDKRKIQTGGKIDSISISPDEKWIAYTVKQGEPEGRDMYYEIQDIWVVSLDNQYGPYQLTERGGAIEQSHWNQDGTLLAYSDWDSNDISQLYVWSPEKNNIVQLTQLTDTTSEIGELHWSPDGTRVAFSFRDREAHVNIPLLGIIDISGSEHRLSTLEVASSGFWWQSPEVLAVPGFYITSNGVGADGIHWIDITTGESIQHFLISESPGSYIIMPQLLNENELGFFGGDNRFYTYDLFTRVLEKQANFGDSLLISQWKAAPASFPGENACQP